VTLKSCSLIVTMLLGLCTFAQAGRVLNSSSYGGNFGFSTPATCGTSSTTPFSVDSADFSFSCDSGGADITGEVFPASTRNDLIMFDFKVTNAPSNYILTLTANGAPINSANDIGMFLCDGSSNSPQCGTSPPGVNPADYGSLVGNVATFPVTGAPPGSTFVFFVALNDPALCGPAGGCSDPCDPSVDTCVRQSASVHASLTPSTSAVPEPRLLPLLGLGLLSFVSLRRLGRTLIIRPRRLS
jgi:hypothetical protein